MTEERYYRKIVCGDEGLYDKNGGCIIVDIRSNLNLDENWDTIICLLNEQQSTIDKLEQRDYYNQSERYKILCRAIELTANYIDNTNEEYYDFCALVTEFEKELLDDE